jgi:hypothetical protein
MNPEGHEEHEERKRKVAVRRRSNEVKLSGASPLHSLLFSLRGLRGASIFSSVVWSGSAGL